MGALFELLIRNFVFNVGLFFNAILFIPQAITLFQTKNMQGNSIMTCAGFNVMQLYCLAWLFSIGFLLSFVMYG